MATRTLGKRRMVSTSASVSLPPRPRALSGMAATYILSAPNSEICFITASCEPVPTASITMTEATPITMPSNVRPVRKRWIHITRQAARSASCSSESRARGVSAASAVFAGEGKGSGSGSSSTGARPLSDTMQPSRISITRRARCATSRSCVMRITVWPAAAISSSSAITSSPLRESSAPVGSSASTMRPPFMSARAIDTRCCWPPDSWCGRWPSRSPRPRRVSSPRAREARSAGAAPA
ncbi:hypothetical protein D9M68_496460 [compost metagenome]